MTDTTQDDLIYLNGISGETGKYAVPPLTLEQISSQAKRMAWGADHWEDLQIREFNKQENFQILPQYGDGSNLKKARWGIIFPAAADSDQVDSILLAMDKLISLREKQMGGLKAVIYRGADGFQWLKPPLAPVLRPETKNEWLSRHHAGPGQVDPSIVPYYLLIVGDPQSIPYQFQTELDVQYAVGRIYFNTLEEYARYAASVEAASKKTGGVKLKREAVFFGPANPGDKSTNLSSKHLVAPLHKYFTESMADLGVGWESKLVEPADSDRSTLAALLGGSQTPALLFTASHGIDFSYMNPTQYTYQGGLVCQDWKGPNVETVTRKHYLTAAEIPDTHSLLGSVIFHFACFGAGTPYWDEYAIMRLQNKQALAARPFIAALPNRLLSLPGGGALAVIGHIDRGWSFSFQWSGIEEQNTAYQGTLYQLMAGKPVGLAMESLNDRYSEIATMLANTLQDQKHTKNPTPAHVARTALEFAQHNDARGYVILGDPAACIPLAAAGQPGEPRPALTVTSTASGRMPVILDADAFSALTEDERASAERENTGQAPGAAEGLRPAAPVLEYVRDAPPQTPQQPGDPPQPSPGRPFSTPLDGLAFALQAYTSDEVVSFSVGVEGVSFNLLDDAKNKVKDVVTSLNNALGNLTKKLEQATSDVATLQVITGVVEDLDTFDPKTAENRIITRISAGGDIEVYLPREGPSLDEDLLALHQSMVRQALSNRLEVARAVAEMIAGLFGGKS